MRVRPAHRDFERSEPYPEQWLLIEWPSQETEPTKYWLATLPAETKLKDLVRMAKYRWIIDRWIHIPKPSQFRSGERRAASFVFSRRPQRHDGCWLRPVCWDVFLICACSKWRERCENTAASMKCIRVDAENCSFFVPI